MAPDKNSINYSIVICTYNPDERLLRRCLQAIFNLDISGISTEVILVDNNSQSPVETLSYVREFLTKIPSMKILLVVKQGLKYARMAGIEQAKGEYIVYFDDDNEPQSDYLQQLKKNNAQYPQVGALGAGDVSVDFIDSIDKKIENYARISFHGRQEETIKFASISEWQPCYPFGTGLCTYASLLKEYAQLAKQKKFTLPGRLNSQLTEGEDMQIVLFCVSKGYFAGVSPGLKIKRNIREARANTNYLKRMVYSTEICYHTSISQSFPTYKKKLKQEMMSGSKFSAIATKKYLQAKLSADPEKTFDLVGFIALNAGGYEVLNKPIPSAVKKIIKNLKLV